MKKTLYIMLVLLLAALISACSSEGQAGKENEGAADAENSSGTVEITLPASTFEGSDVEQVIADAKAEGVKEVIKNEDDSLTYKMSESVHSKIMKRFEENIMESIEGMKENGNYPFVHDISYDESFSRFTIVVDKAAYENSVSKSGVLSLGMAGMYYQLYAGADPEAFVIVKDKETGEAIDEKVFREPAETGSENDLLKSRRAGFPPAYSDFHQHLQFPGFLAGIEDKLRPFDSADV
ncbi:hypothetical protein D3H55_09665 [Bacillus salacetis]|uniref:Antigen I/II N-terminal domain-containing protein n=1 Tax=Bacillus salacetis TaxID=2315464 RepID=A0A3A1R3H7_9BACI|nr:hypothetical protein [Bacillus salacetis]RIW34242.1 hypothetical protein D3H55_09665 [Bacillus salacetis]